MESLKICISKNITLLLDWNHTDDFLCHSRVKDKVLTMTYKALHDWVPVFLWPHPPLLTDPVIWPPDYSSNKDAPASRSLAPPFPVFVTPLPRYSLAFVPYIFSQSHRTTFLKQFKAHTPHSPDFNSPHSPDSLYQSYYLLRFIFSLPPIYFILYLFIYLAVPGLSCGMWDLVPSSSLTRGPLHRKHGILATGPPGKFHPAPPPPPYPLEFKFLEGREFSLFYTLLGSSGWNTTSLNMLRVSECIDWMRGWRKGRCPSSRFGDLRWQCSTPWAREHRTRSALGEETLTTLSFMCLWDSHVEKPSGKSTRPGFSG